MNGTRNLTAFSAIKDLCEMRMIHVLILCRGPLGRCLTVVDVDTQLLLLCLHVKVSPRDYGWRVNITDYENQLLTATSLSKHFHVRVKGMSDERQSRPISSANKIVQQKSVVCHAKIGHICLPLKSSDFIVQLGHALFSTRKSPNFYAVTRRNTLTS